MYQYVGYYHPFTPHPYTSPNMVLYPYSYPYVYQAPYARDYYSYHPLSQVWQQDLRALNVAGLWNTYYGKTRGQSPEIPLMLQLKQEGNHVSGTYFNASQPNVAIGYLGGELSQNILTGTWENTVAAGATNKGRFQFTFTDEQSFTGEWNYGIEPPYYPWNGTKAESILGVPMPEFSR
ncbi:hypothetical protein [Brevibacillus porteri]|uniref:hypothetical protein n=1 Tax=Brevibacillus porteri TaxID=2126350 RepID=UPI003D1CA470